MSAQETPRSTSDAGNEGEALASSRGIDAAATSAVVAGPGAHVDAAAAPIAPHSVSPPSRKAARKAAMRQRARERRVRAAAEAAASGSTADGQSSAPSSHEGEARPDLELVHVVPESVVAGGAGSGAVDPNVLRFPDYVCAAFSSVLPTKSSAKRAIKAGRITLNGEAKVETCRRVAAGDTICVSVPRASGVPTASGEDVHVLKMMQRAGLKVVFEDDDCAVIAKPPGFHSLGRSRRTVGNVVKFILRPSSRTDAALAPSPCHRLDARVSGLLLVGKTISATAWLNAELEGRRAHKRYRAVLLGRLDPTVVVASIRPGGSTTATAVSFVDDSDLPPHACEDDDAAPHVDEGATGCRSIRIFAPIDGREAQSILRVVGYTRNVRHEWVTTVDLYPITGRMHQLRMHCAGIGFPMVGDDLYTGLSTTAPLLAGVELRTRGSPPAAAGGGDAPPAAVSSIRGTDTPATGRESSSTPHSQVGQAGSYRGYGLLLQCVAVTFRHPGEGHKQVHVRIAEVPKFAKMRQRSREAFLRKKDREPSADTS